MVLVGATYLISALLLLENSGNAYVVMFLKALFVNTPIYISCVTLMLAFLFNNDNETNAVSGWGIVYVVIPIAMFLIGKKIAVLGTIAAWIPWNVIRDFDMEQRIYAWQTASGAVKYIIMGLGWTVVFFAIGFYKFSKKDIK